MSDKNEVSKKLIVRSTFLLLVVLLLGCSSQVSSFSSEGEIWGIYQLDLNSDDIQLVYGGEGEIIGLSLDPSGNTDQFQGGNWTSK